METNQLCLNCLLWPFSSVIVSSDESSGTMPHSLELSAVCSSAVLITIAGRRLCLLLIPGKAHVAVGALAKAPSSCRKCCDYCSLPPPQKNCVFSSPHLCLKTSWFQGESHFTPFNRKHLKVSR